MSPDGGRDDGAGMRPLPPVKAFLEGQGYDVKGEVRGCDVVGTRGGEPPVIVELKRRFNLAPLLQGVDRLSLTDRVYLRRARPHGRRDPGASVYRRMCARLCRRLGLGLMTVELAPPGWRSRSTRAISPTQDGQAPGALARRARAPCRRSDPRWSHADADRHRVPSGGAAVRPPHPRRSAREPQGVTRDGNGSERRAYPAARRLRLVSACRARHLRPDRARRARHGALRVDWIRGRPGPQAPAQAISPPRIGRRRRGPARRSARRSRKLVGADGLRPGSVHPGVETALAVALHGAGGHGHDRDPGRRRRLRARIKRVA